ncbi:Uncharacterized protein APZ42_010694, partial [Daphnia magna]
NMGRMTSRHDAILDRLQEAINKAGHTTRKNRAYGNSSLRPDLVVDTDDGALIIDITVPFDEPSNLQLAHERKVTKYTHLGNTMPFVVGSLGAWLPSNDLIARAVGIGAVGWNKVRRDTRLLAIQGSLRIAREHIRGERCHKSTREDPAAPG